VPRQQKSGLFSPPPFHVLIWKVRLAHRHLCSVAVTENELAELAGDLVQSLDRRHRVPVAPAQSAYRPARAEQCWSAPTLNSISRDRFSSASLWEWEWERPPRGMYCSLSCWFCRNRGWWWPRSVWEWASGWWSSLWECYQTFRSRPISALASV
jgi:hypothetical protein